MPVISLETVRAVKKLQKVSEKLDSKEKKKILDYIVFLERENNLIPIVEVDKLIFDYVDSERFEAIKEIYVEDFRRNLWFYRVDGEVGWLYSQPYYNEEYDEYYSNLYDEDTDCLVNVNVSVDKEDIII